MVLFLAYLLKVSATMLGLFMIYYLLFRHHTFHQTNRVCLLFILLFSFTVPAVSVSVPGSSVVPLFFETSRYYDYYGHIRIGPAEQVQNQTFTRLPDIFSIFITVYLLGVVFFSYRFFKSLAILWTLARQTSTDIQNRFRIKRTNFNASFAFLNTIFIPRSQNDPIILKHEQAHVRQFHWMDLLVAEITSIVLWFNPVLILLKRELRLQHEFLADRAVMAEGVSFEVYARCLVNNIGAGVSGINTISPWHSASCKKRILMMAKSKTSKYNLFFYLLLVPVSAVMLVSFGGKSHEVRREFVQRTQGIAAHDTPDIPPVDLTKVTKMVLFGEVVDRRTNKLKNHTGVDFELLRGSDVVATADGIVVVQSHGEKRGNYVIIKHDEVFKTRFFHLERALVKRGDRVSKGEVIGLVGNTGLSALPHLHYEILKNDSLVDPGDYLPTLPGL